MIARAVVVAAARTLLDTPYHSHERQPGLGVDCIGVPIVTAWLAGVKPRTFDFQGYRMQPDGSLLPLCDTFMQRVSREAMQPGDVAVFQFGAQPHHMGVLGDYRHGGLSIIHAENYRHRKVIEHRFWLDDTAMKFVGAYSMPGVEA